MKLEIIFDTVCPWCYIGKRRLDAALELRQDLELEIQWWPFMLNPQMPPDGMDRQTYLDEKFGGRARASAVYGMIEKAGTECGLDFRFDKIRTTPNSVDSHRLVSWCSDLFPDKLEDLVEKIFIAYFIDGQDIGDAGVLTAIASGCGIDGETVGAFLASADRRDGVLAADASARRMGVQGVPAFIAGNRYVLSGAQDPVALGRWLDTARQSI